MTKSWVSLDSWIQAQMHHLDLAEAISAATYHFSNLDKQKRAEVLQTQVTHMQFLHPE